MICMTKPVSCNNLSMAFRMVLILTGKVESEVIMSIGD
jgi:hypothetical protein